MLRTAALVVLIGAFLLTGGVAAQGPALTSEQRAELERWWDSQPKVTLPFESSGVRVFIVEFTDLQCPFCRQFAITSFDEIKKNWIDTGKLRYFSRDFPLDFHAQAMPAARAARCAGEQGKFWEMRMGLMRNANLLTADYITRTAGDLKLEAKAFASCAASTKFDAEIQAEMAEGAKLGVGGTPTFIMGRTTATAVEGPMMVGALPYAQFDAKLKALLGPDSK